MTDKKAFLRSDYWFGQAAAVDVRAHHTGKMVNSKLTLEELCGTTGHPAADRTESGRRPCIAVAKFGGDLNPCQAMHDHHLGDRVAEGVRSAGGIPLRFDVSPPLGEPLTRPTSMYMRNLTALSLMETIIANPIDGIVLLTGCDKTVPAGLMAALLTDIPTIVASAGPMLNGYYHGEQSASGIHLWKNRELLAAGEITEEELMIRSCAAQPSAGHCMSMGTASTLNSLAEALGLTLMGASSIPAPMAERAHYSYRAGAAAVEMVLTDRRPSTFINRQSFLNAVAANAAIGGSTNAIVHLLAIARMAGIEFTLDDWQKYGSNVPLLVNVKPSGAYLMEEYFRAGGMPAVLRELSAAGYVDGNSGWCTGKTMTEELGARDPYTDTNVIRTVKVPLLNDGGIVILHGNLCPDGAVIKVSAVSNKALLQHRGQAVVFDSIEEYHKRIDDPAEGITTDKVLVLRNCGPLGYPGMPEVGNVRPPGYLLAKGVKAMVTVSDARMSGTAYGCHVLHVSPEAAAGGPLALVKTGDFVTLDVAGGKLDMDVDAAELEARRKALNIKPTPIHSPWGVIWGHPDLGVHQASVGAYMKMFDRPELQRDVIAKRLRERLRPQH
ncbi:MAG: dihydroxy-acid dehydratase [Micavibrio sp.]|nr:dihydroxy-acid dehydratase [Micavibrio sp.]